MKPGRLPTRLLAESLLAVAAAAGLVLALTPVLAPPLAPTTLAALQVLAMLLLAAPALYWRAMQALRRAWHGAGTERPGAPARDAADTRALGRLNDRRQRAIAMTGTAQMAGLAVTALVVGYLQQQIEADLHRRFERHAERLETEVQRRFELGATGLKAARAARGAAPAATAAHFTHYVALRDPQRELPGVLAFGVLAPEPGEPPGYRVQQVEPAADAAAAAGSAWWAEPALRQAIAQALGSRQPTLARHPPAAGVAAPDFVLLLAEPAGSLLFAPISVPELLQGVAAAAADGALDFQLLDGEADGARLLFDSRLPPAPGAEAAAVRPGRALETRRTLVIGDHELVLQAQTGPRFEASIDRRPLLYTALGGALLSLLLALVVWALASARIRAQTLAERMTADLDRLAQVVRHTSNAVTITDPQLRITWINEGFTRLTGYEAAEALGRTPGELLTSGQADPAVLRQLAEAAAAGRACRVEIQNRARDGRLYWVNTEIQPLHDRQGRLTGFMEIGSDITDRRLAGEQLLAATEALTIARDRAEQASVAKSRFLANMSHEIRTPMNAVLGMLKLLRRTPLEANQRDYAEKADGAARALLGLLNDILDFSKVEAGKLALDPRPFRLRQVLADLQVILAANLGGKPVALRMTLDEAVPAVLVGDDLRLQQILVNLAGNAIKFTAQGEVVVAVQALAVTATEARLGFEVRDTGIGIAPEQQQSIFDVFSQAEASTTRRFGGTGLGLSICRRLVGMMGGQISLHSTPGEGSRFSFELTLAVGTEAEAPLPVADSRHPAGPRLAGLRLLVVEDNANNQQVAQELLAGEGALVQLAGDGAQALAAVAQATSPFHAVLMDVQMPVMDGYTATRHLREAGHTRLPIIAMTANALAGDREASLAAGMDDHVGKPFDLDALVAVLQRRVAAAAGLTPPAPPTVPDDDNTTPARPAVALPPAALALAQAHGIALATAIGRLGGRPEVWLRSARAFVPELTGMARRHTQLLAQQRWTDAAALMHTVKGVAATLGAQALASEAAALELALKQAAVEGPPPQAPAIVATLADTGLALAALVQALQAAGAADDSAARDAGALAAALAPVAELLRHDDMAATDAFAELEQAHGEAWSDELRPLADAMAALDFKRALQCWAALDLSLQSAASGETPAARPSSAAGTPGG